MSKPTIVTLAEFKEDPQEALRKFVLSAMLSPEGCDKCCLACSPDCWRYYTCSCRYEPCSRIKGEEEEQWRKIHIEDTKNSE